MSVNQSRVENKNEFFQSRKSGFVPSNTSSGHHLHHNRHFSGFASNRGYKKSGNAQSGQPRGNSGSVNTSSGPNLASGVGSVESGVHVQSSLHGVSDAPAPSPKPADISVQKSSKPISKAPLSQSASMTTGSTLPPNPAKGDGGKGFPLQFGSISPGFVNGTKVPPRTSSAPPNMDEQKREQARRDAFRAASAVPVPATSKQQVPGKDVSSTRQPASRETHNDPKIKGDVQVASAPLTQPQKPPVFPLAGMSMPMPFQQPTVPLQFGGTNPQIQSQGVPNTSFQMPLQMQLQMGNPPQVQQQVFVPSLQPHLMQTQGMIHHNHSLGYNPHLGHQLPQQMNMGMNMSPLYNQQQIGSFGTTRKTVKITHPETHEELRLDNISRDGGSPGSKAPHGGPPQSRPPTFNQTHPVSYYPNTYSGGPPLFPGPSSVSVTSSQSTSSPPRFNHPVSQASPTLSFTNQSASNSLRASKGGSLTHGNQEPSSLGFAQDARNELPSARSASTAVSVKTSDGFNAVKKAETQNLLCPAAEPSAKKNLEASAANSSLQSKPGPVSANNVEKETVIKSESARDVQKQPEKGYFQPSNQSNSSVLQVHGDSSKVATSTCAEVKTTCSPSGTGYGASLAGKESPVDLGLQCEEGKDQHDAGFTENVRPKSSSGSNKTTMEPGKTKNNKGKKKRKEILQKADGQGTTSDLYMAYKDLEEKKETAGSIKDSSEGNLKAVSGDATRDSTPWKKRDEQKNPEVENWEDSSDVVVPKLGGSHEGGVTRKKYSRDFLLTFSEQCTYIPEGFDITTDIADTLMRNNLNASRSDQEYPSTGRINDRPSGVARVDRRGNGTMDTDRWVKSQGHPLGRGPGVDFANVIDFRPGANYGGSKNPHGILSGPMHSMGFQGMQRNNPDAERWERATNFNKGLMPPPVAMHKAENKYEVGKVSDEEQAKQRRLKAILNKLTPQNFEKLFEQVKEVNIDNVVTLTGVISQIFDKALMEPTFCEMYANFCSHLALELPDLSVDNEKITFKRLLLNKCQEEFERGEREEEEANQVDGESETKQSEEEREQKRLKARRRMLGNIRLIGELYKKRMLTERIMHECIKKLLGQYQNPDEENIEALCKLMSTIGEMIDHPKAKEHMDAYFDIMRQLSNNMKLSSRLRFMLKDAIDLRKNKWQQRRKVEGPKKIEEVHRDAAQERQGQAARLSRGPTMNSGMRRGQPFEYGSRSPMLSSPVGMMASFKGGQSQARAYVGQDGGMNERSVFENRTPSVPLPQRSSGDQSITLGPQGGLARGMSCRGQPSVSGAPSAGTSSFFGDPRRTVGGLNGYNNTLDREAYSREDQLDRHAAERIGAPSLSDQSHGQQINSKYMHGVSENPDRVLDRSVLTSSHTSQAGTSPTQNPSSEKVWPEERLQEMSIAAIKEYYSANDEKEVALCIKDLNAPGFYPTVVSNWVTDAFERKDMERNMLAKLLVSLAKPSEGVFKQDQLVEGFKSVLTNLEDTVNDAPRAPEFLGRIFGKLILEDVLPLKNVGRLIHEGGEEPGRLLEAGVAADVLGSVLEMIKLEKGEPGLNGILVSSNLRLEDFRPPEAIRSKKLEMFI